MLMESDWHFRFTPNDKSSRSSNSYLLICEEFMYAPSFIFNLFKIHIIWFSLNLRIEASNSILHFVLRRYLSFCSVFIILKLWSTVRISIEKTVIRLYVYLNFHRNFCGTISDYITTYWKSGSIKKEFFWYFSNVTKMWDRESFRMRLSRALNSV